MRGFRPALAMSYVPVAHDRSIEKWWQYIPPATKLETGTSFTNLDSLLC